MKPTFIAALVTLLLSACGGSDCNGPQCKVVNFEALYTSAPAAVTVTVGDSASFSIGGGTSPYLATSSNPSISTSLVSGTKLSIAGVSGGQGQVAIVDSAGKTVTLGITVANRTSSTAPPTIFPASITIGACTTNVPFVFTGGAAPFSVYTSDNFNAPVSAALPLGTDHFFTASIKDTPFPGKTTLTVLDSQSRTATATILTDSSHTCPTNPLLQTFPATANLRVKEKLSFQIGGGIPPFSVTATNQNIATVFPQPTLNITDQKYYFDVMAKSTGSASMSETGTSLLTVTSSDGQKTNIIFTVFPAP